LRQSRTIDTLGAEHVDVVELRELFRRERFRRSERHVTGVVNHDIETSLLGHDLADGRIGRLLRADIEFDGTQIDVVIAGVFFDIGGLGGVAAGGAAHRRVNSVARLGQGVGGQPAKAAGRAGDDDDLFHDTYPFCDWLVRDWRCRS
jgi:hypothetical protein